MLRIERLSADAQELLRVLAAGRRLDHADPRRGVRHRPARAARALREAVAAQLVVADEEGFYAFRHALLREVVVDDLLPGERAELHLALARALERRAEGLPDHGGAHLAAGIAHHYLASGDQPAALAASVRAAQAAEAVHANGEAAALYSRALQLWDRVADAEELTGRDHVELLRAAAWTTAASTSRRAPSPTCARRWPSSATATRCARRSCSSCSPASSSARAARPTAAETRREALELLPDGAERDARDAARRPGQGADARVAPPGGGRGRRRGDRGRAGRRRRGVRAARAGRARASRCSGSARYEEGERALREALDRMRRTAASCTSSTRT